MVQPSPKPLTEQEALKKLLEAARKTLRIPAPLPEAFPEEEEEE